MTPQNRRINSGEELQEADETLRDAQLLFDHGRYQGATARAYYAAFHAVKALLLTKSLEVKSHHGVAHLFRLHFIKTNIVAPKYSQILARAQKYREEADYHHAMEFTQEQAKDTLTEVQDLLAVIRTHLQKE